MFCLFAINDSKHFKKYFTARWFSKNIESNRNILEHILFDCPYGIVRNIIWSVNDSRDSCVSFRKLNVMQRIL